MRYMIKNMNEILSILKLATRPSLRNRTINNNNDAEKDLTTL